MSIDTAQIEWPADLLDDEEQDEPLAGQDHVLTIQNLVYPLYGRLRSSACSVASELRVHRDPRDLHDYREPDILVAFGVPDRIRRRYLIWEEGKAPDLTLEVLSPSSFENGDLTRKRDWYRKEGVREYIVLDPSGEFAPEPRLQTWRFHDLANPASDGMQHVLADADGVLRSALIPFGWVVDGDWVRVVDLHTGELFPMFWDLEPLLQAELRQRQQLQTALQQAEERAQAATERAQAEAHARRELEAEIVQLRRQLDRQD
ncbi:MAG: Uma2 family endonuclease [Chloroflexota bacterium]